MTVFFLEVSKITTLNPPLILPKQTIVSPLNIKFQGGDCKVKPAIA